MQQPTTDNSLTDTLNVIDAAEAGDTVAHHSLVRAICEMLDRGEKLPLLLADYAIRCLVSNSETLVPPNAHKRR
jgi:hypothetical protein